MLSLFKLQKMAFVCLRASSLFLVALVYSRSNYQNTNSLIGRLGLLQALYICSRVSFIDIHWGKLVRVY